ncbi:MAG: hypothetical protein P1V36_05665, partial [Planctomycetota bacterium]|nr:hypothetical protein [Planctomycetota bacterium]
MPGWTARIALREVRASWGPALCVALLTGIVVVLVAGGERARRMLLHTRAVTYETLQHADLELRFAPTHPRVAALAREVDGVAEAAERLLLPGILEIAGRRPRPTLVAVLP